MRNDNATSQPRRIDPELAAPAEPPFDTNSVGASDADPARRDLRAEVGKYVSLAEFPTNTTALVNDAVARGAPDFVIAALRALPADQSLPAARDLWIALDLEATERF